MAGKAPNYTILLSVRSPIFAPLYLAKIRGNAFRNIDFKYAFELPTYGSEGAAGGNRGDHLAYRVLSKAAENEHFIAGVADPFRCLVLDSDGALYKPKVLGSMIRHQTFWLASDHKALKSGTASEALAKCRYIISQPTYTSGYAVLTDFLTDQGFAENPAIAERGLYDVFGTVGVYHKTLPGFEREHYKYMSRKFCRGANYAYLTTNPADHEEPIVQFSNRRFGEKYRHTLMSALFCGNGLYCKYPMLFDDIRGDIVRAMEAIQCDPIGVAVELKDYSSISGDRFMDFSNKAIRHRRLVEILDDLIRDGVYALDMSLSGEDVARGASIRRNFQEARRESETADLYFTDPDRFIAEYFDAFCVRSATGSGAQGTQAAPASAAAAGTAPAATTGDIERTEHYPPFVRQSMRNYRRMADKYYELPVPAPIRPAQAANQSATTGLRRTVRYLLSPLSYLASCLDVVALWLGGLAAVPCTLGALGVFRPARLSSIGAPLWSDAYWQWFGPEFALTLLSIVLLFVAYLQRYAKSARKSLRFDLFLTLGLYVDTSVVVWAVLIMLDHRLTDKLPMIPSDQMSVELFLFSILILTFGALWLTASERITEVWDKVVLGWVEWRILNFRVKQAPLPPMRCGVVPLCHACPAPKAAGAQNAALAAPARQPVL